MKHAFYAFIAIMLMSDVLSAQKSNLIVFSEQGEKIFAVLNGIKQNAEAQTNIRVTGMNEGGYKLKVIFADGMAPDIDKSIYMEPAKEMTVNVKKNKDGQYVIRLVSTVDIASALAPYAEETMVVYSVVPPPPVQQSTTITTTTNTGANPNASNVNVGTIVNGAAMNVNMSVNEGSTMTQQTTVTTTTTTTSSGSTNHDAPNMEYVPGYSGPTGCEMPMAPGDFGSAKSTISSKTFESSKEEIAKQIVGSNCLTATQVKEIMLLFEYETTKLEFAKFAYAHTYDKGNYFKVNDAFGFESSISDLNEYIKGR